MQSKVEQKRPQNLFKNSRLSRKSAAEYLGINVGTLAKWASVGNPCIPYHKVGKKVVYLQADLDAFLVSNRVEGVGSKI